jgi:formylglycine-generating enzyme required for sulfatase activity
MRHNASKHPPMGNQNLHPGRRVAGRPAIGIFLTLGVLISGLMIPSGAQTPPAPGARLEPFTQALPNSVVKIEMLPVPGGTIKIGTQMVTVKPFWMAKTETPWEVYDVFLASGPPSPAYDQTEYPADAIARPSKSYILPDLGWGHNGYPAINVSFISTVMFCRWLSSATGKKYRLPTEAEWELACRGGNTGPWKMDKALIAKSAWFGRRSTEPVGKKLPNKLGLHDMLGNPGEWATDLEGKPVLCGPIFLDPLARITPGIRRRWTPKWQETDPQLPKSRWWLADGKFVGFRVVCEP